jgi:hypothetical protein
MSEIHIQEGQYPGGAISWDRPRRTAAGLTAVGGGFTRPRAAQPLAATAKTRYMSAADDRLGRVLRQLVASAGAPPPPAAASAATATTTPRLRVAAIISVYNPLSHADVIVTKFLKGMSTDDGFHPPEVDVVSMWIDCVLEADIGLALAAQHRVPTHPSIRAALHAGGTTLGVDAVLLVGEHGDYPHNERGRHQYPRRYFFEQIAGVFAEAGRSVPVFIDKHFAYSTADATWMWKRASELQIPLMAGSSLPTVWRSPTFLEYPLGVELESALSLGYGSSGLGGAKHAHLLRHFILKVNHFTKTGSGQT